MKMTDYEEARRSLRLDVPADFNFTRDIVDGWARSDPQKVALVAPAPYTSPREIECVAELPKTISGKIRRSELRARA